MSNSYFQFKWFDELQKGDVFKFSPILDNDIPSKYYTVSEKDNITTKIGATYGHALDRREYRNDLHREVMIFPNKKRQSK
jgi:hypothetical protein